MVNNIHLLSFPRDSQELPTVLVLLSATKCEIQILTPLSVSMSPENQVHQRSCTCTLPRNTITN